jgi:hypothetical protein
MSALAKANEHLNPMPFEAAVQMEMELAEDLRAAGYRAVLGLDLLLDSRGRAIFVADGHNGDNRGPTMGIDPTGMFRRHPAGFCKPERQGVVCPARSPRSRRVGATPLADSVPSGYGTNSAGKPRLFTYRISHRVAKCRARA